MLWGAALKNINIKRTQRIEVADEQVPAPIRLDADVTLHKDKPCTTTFTPLIKTTIEGTQPKQCQLWLTNELSHLCCERISVPKQSGHFRNSCFPGHMTSCPMNNFRIT